MKGNGTQNCVWEVVRRLYCHMKMTACVHISKCYTYGGSQERAFLLSCLSDFSLCISISLLHEFCISPPPWVIVRIGFSLIPGFKFNPLSISFRLTHSLILLFSTSPSFSLSYRMFINSEYILFRPIKKDSRCSYYWRDSVYISARFNKNCFPVENKYSRNVRILVVYFVVEYTSASTFMNRIQRGVCLLPCIRSRRPQVDLISCFSELGVTR